jgi:DNA-binding IclR family transcriptional regulator
MERSCLLEKNPVTKKYRIGIRLLQIGLLYPLNHPVTRIAKPHINSLAKTYAVNVNIGVLLQYPPYCVVMIDSLVNFDPTILLHRMSNNIPLYCSGLGKVFLAFSDEQLVESILPTLTLKPYTPTTITDMQHLRDEIRRTQERGFALDRGEIQADLYCIAAPIRDNNGLAAAISISDRAEKMNALHDELITQLLDTAKIISYQLGDMT